MFIKIDTIHDIQKFIKNMINKKMDSPSLHDEILKKIIDGSLIKYVKKIMLFPTEKQHMLKRLAPIIKQITRSIGI